jgi:ketosteroid isomerase-like protein
MSDELTREVVRRFYNSVASGADPETIADLFSRDADWDIPGAVHLVAWIGQRKGRNGIIAFFRELRENIEPLTFTITSTLVEGEKAATFGHLRSRVKRTGKVIESSFATELTVRDGKITSYRFFEDSYAVVEAVR